MKRKFSVVVTLMLLTLSTKIFAAEIPIKEISDIGSDCILVLTENGDLYYTQSLNSSTKKLFLENVVDIIIEENIYKTENYVYTTDGRVLEISGRYEPEIEDEYQGFVKTPISLKKGLYIDYSDNLILGDSIIMENVILADEYYALTTNGKLYSFDSFHRGDETKFIMSDVKEFSGDMILKTNGDLYYKQEDVINKVLNGVESCQSILYSGFHYYVINDKNELYMSEMISYNTEMFQFEKIGDGISKLIELRDLGSDLFAVSVDGKLYEILPNSNTKLYLDTKNINITNIKLVRGGRQLFFTDGNILLKNGVPIYEIGFIKEMYEIDNNCVFINTVGDVYISDLDLNTFTKTNLSEKSTVLKINDEICELENRLQIIDGRTMYPFREILELIGASVYWDNDNKIAVGETEERKIEFPIGKNEYYLNGEKYEMDTAAYIDSTLGRTYIPIRYAAEGLGYTVDWIPGEFENIISIHK